MGVTQTTQPQTINRFDKVDTDNGLFDKPRVHVELRCIDIPDECKELLDKVNDEVIFCSYCKHIIKNDDQLKLHMGCMDPNEQCGQNIHSFLGQDMWQSDFGLNDGTDPDNEMTNLKQVIEYFDLTDIQPIHLKQIVRKLVCDVAKSIETLSGCTVFDFASELVLCIDKLPGLDVITSEMQSLSFVKYFIFMLHRKFTLNGGRVCIPIFNTYNRCSDDAWMKAIIDSIAFFIDEDQIVDSFNAIDIQRIDHNMKNPSDQQPPHKKSRYD
eukprot:814772_1